MHDFLLAKEIFDEILKIIKEKDLQKVKKIKIKIGQIALAHDGFDEHIDDVSIDNLIFGLQSLAKDTILCDTNFDIERVSGDKWEIVELEV